MAALARHVCLKAPDKADFRAAATEAAAQLAKMLAPGDQEQFVGFVYGLSRSPAVGGERSVGSALCRGAHPFMGGALPGISCCSLLRCASCPLHWQLPGSCHAGCPY